MLIEGHNPETGETFSREAEEVDKSSLEKLLSFEMTRQDVTDMINNLDVSADVKVLLDRIAQATITIGGAVVWIGRIILKAISFLLAEFPNASFGAIAGAVLGYLVSTIPVIGFVLGPVITPLLVILGAAFGLINDVQFKRYKSRVLSVLAPFKPLRTD